MGKKIYVGNLPWSTTSASLESLFSQHGTVTSAEVIADRETGRSRGFGFVEMESDEACQRAIQALNGAELEGRAITVNEARERARARVAEDMVAAEGEAAAAAAVAAAAATAAVAIIDPRFPPDADDFLTASLVARRSPPDIRSASEPFAGRVWTSRPRAAILDGFALTSSRFDS